MAVEAKTEKTQHLQCDNQNALLILFSIDQNIVRIQRTVTGVLSIYLSW